MLTPEPWLTSTLQVRVRAILPCSSSFPRIQNLIRSQSHALLSVSRFRTQGLNSPCQSLLLHQSSLLFASSTRFAPQFQPTFVDAFESPLNKKRRNGKQSARNRHQLLNGREPLLIAPATRITPTHFQFLKLNIARQIKNHPKLPLIACSDRSRDCAAFRSYNTPRPIWRHMPNCALDV